MMSKFTAISHVCGLIEMDLAQVTLPSKLVRASLNIAYQSMLLPPICVTFTVPEQS